jgi:hypothetical protein
MGHKFLVAGLYGLNRHIFRICSDPVQYEYGCLIEKNFENEHGGKWAFRTLDMVREMRGVAG